MLIMSKHNQYPKKVNTFNRQLRTGTTLTLAALGIVAPPADAQLTQNGGTQAPPAAIIETGGIQSASAESTPTVMTQAEQQLNAKAQRDMNSLARLGLKVNPKSHKTVNMQGTNGDKLAQTTITAAAVTRHGSNQGQRRIDIVAPLASDGHSLDLNKVDSITFSEGITNKDGILVAPTSEVKIGKNPGTGAIQASGLYQSFKGGEQPMLADVVPTVGDPQALTYQELAATSTQIRDGIIAAGQRSPAPIDFLMPAFNRQGFTTQDPAN